MILIKEKLSYWRHCIFIHSKITNGWIERIL